MPHTPPLTPGDIRRATISARLWDGTILTDHREIVLYDVREVDGAPEYLDVLWVGMTWGETESPGVTGSVRWDRIHADLGTTDQGGALTLRVYQRVGTYKPGSPGANSLEIMRRAAIRNVEEREERRRRLPDALAEAAEQYRATRRQLQDAEEERRLAIRDAIRAGVGVLDIANTVNLSPQRIYQIGEGLF